jgi:hypothetical protein
MTRLTWSMVANTQILGRDRARNRTLLGGLGCMGVGRRWQDDEFLLMDERPEWINAPEMDEAEWHDGGWRLT